MSGGKSEALALVAAGIRFHVEAMAACSGQAKALHAQETALLDAPSDLAGKRDREIQATRLGTQRAVHELEASLHASKLTDLGLELARLEREGIDVGDLTAALLDARTIH